MISPGRIHGKRIVESEPSDLARLREVATQPRAIALQLRAQIRRQQRRLLKVDRRADLPERTAVRGNSLLDGHAPRSRPTSTYSLGSREDAGQGVLLLPLVRAVADARLPEQRERKRFGIAQIGIRDLARRLG